jgi:type VI secretion system secreted protein VgrG
MREYLIVTVRHTASNNIHSAEREPSYYKNEFTCLRKTTRWRPGRHYHSEPPPAPGVLTAIVTGCEGEEIHTDGHGRVKVQFHWDREGKRNENSSAWIRVAMPLAGRQFGQVGLPRVGQEVVVQFMNGNPDRPLVTGIVYNEQQQVPWQLPAQRALSGLRSREVGGYRGNQLVLDDTQGQIQAQLRSDHLHSQLSLGDIHRLETHGGHQEKRGEGFELRTDGHGVVRAGRGMLVSTEARRAGAGDTKAMAETTQRLAAAHHQHQDLGKLAQQFDPSGGTGQAEAAAALDKQNADVKGAGGKFPELGAPHLVLAGSAGIAATAAQSVHVTGMEQVVLTAGANLSLAAIGGLFASARQGLRLFSHKLGMRLIAAGGKVEIRAETDEIEILAQKVLRLISDTDWIELRGRKGVRLHGAGSMIEISDKVQVYSPSPTRFHCNFETLGPQNRPQPAQRPAKTDQEQAGEKQPGSIAPVLQPSARLGEPYASVPYVVTKNGAEIKTGLTDEEGRAPFEHQEGADGYRVRLANDDDFALRMNESIDRAKSEDEAARSNNGHRALNDAADGRHKDS